MMYEIYDKSEMGVYNKNKDIVDNFMKYSHKRLGYNKLVRIYLVSDKINAEDPLGRTGQYNIGQMSITIFVNNRHFKDILRSLAHELVHHNQACRGELDISADIVDGYAQKSPVMRSLEKEAYIEGNLTLRDFEDTNYKNNIKIRINENGV